jgi:hypothetical protein
MRNPEVPAFPIREGGSRLLHPTVKPSGQGNRDFAGEVREAMNKSPHVCARARVGERPVSSLMCSAEAHARPGRPGL